MGSTFLLSISGLVLLISVCQSSVIPAIHTAPTVALRPTYTVGTPLVVSGGGSGGVAVPAIVTAASNQVFARNFNRWYVPTTYNYPAYPTYPTTVTTYKYPTNSWPYGYGYPSTLGYGYGYSYGGLWR